MIGFIFLLSLLSGIRFVCGTDYCSKDLCSGSHIGCRNSGLAELNVKRCIYGHDQCHNTSTFRIPGQNIGKIWWSGGNSNDKTLTKDIIDSWWSEYKKTSMDQIKKYPESRKEIIGHYTVMTADRNVAVGCGAIRLKDSGINNWGSFTLPCNYATTNIIGRGMFEVGNTASKCYTGRNRDYQALYSVSELYDVNKS